MIWRILATVREDYRDYYTVRFFTGLRTGEIDGLKWKYVDFARRLILVRETIVAGEEENATKTIESSRDVKMSQVVLDALQRQLQRTGKVSTWVFCNTEHQPLDHNNVTKRVWYPLLRYLGLERRRPQGCLLIARLAVIECPVKGFVLFETVPPAWVRDRDLLKRAQALLSALPSSYQQLFVAIFWDARRFQGLCTGPSSMEGHHAERSGNLRHTVEVAEQVRALCRDRVYVQRDLAILSALLHDAGKAVEYRITPDGNWELTDRGQLLGHRVTVIEWIAAALARWCIRLPDGHAEALLHNLSSVARAPAWMGLREPRTAEAELLSMADRLSGTDDLMTRCLPARPGWGRFHRHLGRKPFRVADINDAHVAASNF